MDRVDGGGARGAGTADSAPNPEGRDWPDWQRSYRCGALVIVPPADIAEPADALRRQFDSVSAAIFRAHITLTRPFARDPTAADLQRVADTVRNLPQHTLSLGAPTRFPDSAVVYLPVHPAQTLAALRAALLATGLFQVDPRGSDSFVPHLTLSEFGEDPEAVLNAARTAGFADMPLAIHEVSWIAPDEHFHFTARETFSLAR